MRVLIKDIYWKRTYLYIEYESSTDMQIFIQKIKGKKVYFEQASNGIAKLNVCTAHGNENLQAGKYMILAQYQDEDGYKNIKPKINIEILGNLENIARVFRYYEDNYAYIACFELDNQNEPLLIMCTSYMMKNKKPQKSRAFLESKDVVGVFKRLIVIAFENLCNLLYTMLFFVCNKNSGGILIMSENREQMSENLMALDTRLKERGLSKNHKIQYTFRNSVNKKYGLNSWIKLVYKIATSNYIFIDDYAPIFSIINLKNTKLVQLWHAGVGFKLVGYARFGKQGSPHPFKSCHRHYSYGIAGCEALREVYSEVWGIEKDKIIASGLPRLDHFLDNDVIEREKNRLELKYPLFKNKKIILFAPTYRGRTQKTAYYDYSKIDFDALYNYAVENEAIVMFKMHHFIQENVPIDKNFNNVMIEVKDETINSLFYIADVLITDYSSCFYDYSLLKKPILFYAYDKEEYYATRGVHVTLEEMAPGKICTDFESLIKSLNNDYGIEKLDKFFVDRAALKERLASDIIIDNIIQKNKY